MSVFGGQARLGKQAGVCVCSRPRKCVHKSRLTGVKLAPENDEQKSVQSGKPGAPGRQSG